MAHNPLRQSPLAHLGLIARAGQGADDAGIILTEAPFTDHIGLRGDGADTAFAGAVEKALGFALPISPNTVTGKAKKTALWLGPDEWLIVVPSGAADKLIAALGKALTDVHSAVFDVSDSRTVISLSGANARHVLAKGCGLDLHPRTFGPGSCAQSTLALAHILIHQTDTAYRLYIHRSFAEYLWAWLEDAGAEFGVSISTP